MPVPAAAVVVVVVVAAVVGSAAEVEMFVVVVAVAQERQLTGKGDRQKLERAARRPSIVLDGIVVVQRVAVDADIPTSEKILHEEWLVRAAGTLSRTRGAVPVHETGARSACGLFR